jgi:hypothetical protein
LSAREARVRRRLLGVAAIVPAVGAGAAPAQGQGRAFSLDRFSVAVSITVHPDASLDVREAITFDFRGSHQGVYRVIPVRYPRGGFEFALRLDGVQVLDEQFRPLKTNVSYSGRYVRIKAWVPGAVNTAKTVTVVYRVRRGLFNVDDHEELYRNVTGDEWDVPIREAEAVVIGPPAAVPGDARAIAYTGSHGIAGTDYVEQRDGNVLTFRTTRPLRPREGLTIAVAWPPGVVGRPAAWRSAVWFFQDNWPLGLPFLALALGVFVWRSYGRDPGTRRSIKPEYAPPDDLAPAEAGVLVSERAHPSDVVATLVDLAVRGYIRIEPITRVDDEPDFLFRRLKPILGDPAIRPFELFVLAKVFDTDWRLNRRLLSEVRQDYDNVFPPIRDEMYRSMVKRRLFPTSPDNVRRIWLGLGLGILAAAAIVYALPPSWAGYRSGALALGLALSGLVIAAFSPLMPRKTWDGAQAMVRVQGFREFLERAEKDRLERMPADTLHRWLPWAIALGVTERWIWRFDGLPVDAPAWFGVGAEFSLRGYERSVEGFSRRTQEAITTTRRGAGPGSGGNGMSGGSSGGGRAVGAAGRSDGAVV